MPLKLVTSERHFHSDGDSVTLRVLEPSKPMRAWPGNEFRIRQWTIRRRDEEFTYRPCTQEEVAAFEKELGEIKELGFIFHRTLREVAYDATAETPTQKTWVELLGTDTGDTRVNGTEIVRVTTDQYNGIDRCVRLWSFSTNQQATENYNQWLQEVRAAT